jgi:hypothetical protein
MQSRLVVLAKHALPELRAGVAPRLLTLGTRGEGGARRLAARGDRPSGVHHPVAGGAHAHDTVIALLVAAHNAIDGLMLWQRLE